VARAVTATSVTLDLESVLEAADDEADMVWCLVLIHLYLKLPLVDRTCSISPRIGDKIQGSGGWCSSLGEWLCDRPEVSG